VTGSFVSPGARRRVRELATPIAAALGRIGLTPNSLTILGFLGTCAAAGAAAGAAWLPAGILVLAFGAFDLLDGALARATGRVTPFGAFLDSTLDRTGENLVYGGIAVGAAAAQFQIGVILAVLSLSFASVVTYARARAESLGLHGEVGLAPREIRLVVLAASLILTGLAGGIAMDDGGSLVLLDPWGAGRSPLTIGLGFIAILSATTIIQRIVHVRLQLDHPTKPE
jgi:CDP-diacylglycerol--glycerol-3-phosphate 3-phosphatidyltransferase